MSDPDFVTETTQIRFNSYVIEASLKNFQDPATDSQAVIRKRFMEVFGKNAGSFGPITLQILEKDFKADRVTVLATGHVQYFVPLKKKAEDYFR